MIPEDTTSYDDTAGHQLSRRQRLMKSIGPGILFAGAAIGGSHLVQSTRAGSGYGFSLIVIVLLALLFKYPFFEYTHRYTAATGESMLQGYFRLGSGALWVFFLVALVSAFINASAVTLVTASLAGNLLGVNLPLPWLSLLVLLVVGLILLAGRFPFLDLLMKIMILMLSVATITAVVIAFGHGATAVTNTGHPAIWSLTGFSFLLALMGWMPAPLDVAVWPSLWALERTKQTGYRPQLQEALFDFHLGYYTTGILALAFVALGALIMYGSGQEFSNSGVQFAGQLVDLYAQTLGEWSRMLIATVAFITMFSTTLAVLDGYSRTLVGSLQLLFKPDMKAGTRDRLYWLMLPVQMLFAWTFITHFLSGIKSMMDVATILAFLTAPVIAWLNYRVITSKQVSEAQQPGKGLRLLSWLGIIFLSGFSVAYVVWRIVGN